MISDESNHLGQLQCSYLKRQCLNDPDVNEVGLNNPSTERQQRKGRCSVPQISLRTDGSGTVVPTQWGSCDIRMRHAYDSAQDRAAKPLDESCM